MKDNYEHWSARVKEEAAQKAAMEAAAEAAAQLTASVKVSAESCDAVVLSFGFSVCHVEPFSLNNSRIESGCDSEA